MGKSNCIDLLNSKKIFSRTTGKLVNFFEQIDIDTPVPCSDGLNFMDEDVDDDISYMYCLLKDGSIMNMEDFYSEYGAYDENNPFVENIIRLIADRN